MTKYSTQDVNRNTINTNSYHQDLIYAPLEWQKRGRQQTASGYGSKLNTGYKIDFNNKQYRVYCTCYSNSGSCWFQVKGQKIFVH